MTDFKNGLSASLCKKFLKVCKVTPHSKYFFHGLVVAQICAIEPTTCKIILEIMNNEYMGWKATKGSFEGFIWPYSLNTEHTYWYSWLTPQKFTAIIKDYKILKAKQP